MSEPSKLEAGYQAAIMLRQTGHSSGCACEGCLASYVAIITDVRRAERACLLARLGDKDVRAAVLAIVHEHQPWKSVGPETVQAVTGRVLARIRALLERP